MSFQHRLAAYWDLLVRYREITLHFWRNRNELRGGLFTKSEAEFLPAALALQEKPLYSGVRWSGRVLGGLLLCALAWSILGKVDVIVNAPGKIIPRARVKSIASVDIASVKALHVVEGQRVKAGDILIELDSTSSDAERDKAQQEEIRAVTQIARAKAMITSVERGSMPDLITALRWASASALKLTPEVWLSEQQHVEGQYRDYAAKLQRIEGDITRFQKALPIAIEQENAYRVLDASQDISHHAALEKQQLRLELEAQLTDALNQRLALVAETRKHALDEISEAKGLIASLQQDRIRLDTHSRLLKLTAPVDGTVQQLSVHTIGGVVPAAQPLLQIVPLEKLVEVEAQVENKDIGFVQDGYPAQVKIDAFEYSKYGTVPAKVSQVGADAVQDEKRGFVYTTKVTLSRSNMFVDGRTVELTPGMTVMVDIKTGRRRIIEYLLSPLIRHQREALHER